MKQAKAVKVPFLDLQAQVKPFKKKILSGWSEALSKGQFVLTQAVADFEKQAALALGCRHAVAVNSGTDALLIGLRSLGVGPGDQVLTTSFSFFATAETISLCGAEPVFCDVDEKTLLIDPAELERKWTPRVKAVLPVDLFGLPLPMKPILEFAKSRGLAVLSDACQAFGARDAAGACCGTQGDAGAFSFYPTKNLGAAGDGGLMVTNRDEVAKAARELRNHGSEQRYYHNSIGYCSRMDGLQAIALAAKLPSLKRWNQARQKIARAYVKGLQGCADLKPPAWDEACVWHQFTVRVSAARRDALAESLKAAGVASMVFYPLPIHRQKPYAGLGAHLPRTDKAAAEVLSLPIFPEMSQAQVKHVIRSVREFFGS